MRINDLKVVLDEHNIPKTDYSLNEKEPFLVDAVVCIRKQENRFKVYVVERNDVVKSNTFADEDEACKKFLKYFRID